jgi:hypothetical protein
MLSYPFPIADPATCVTFAEACMSFIEKSAWRGARCAFPGHRLPAPTLAIPRRADRPPIKPHSGFSVEKPSRPREVADFPLLCRRLCGAWVTVGQSTGLALD